MTKNQIELAKARETQRNNRVIEQLTRTRDQRAADTRDKELLESWRRSRTAEIETNRSNVARENETKRHNLVSEELGFGNLGVGQSQIGLGYAQLEELKRHQEADEALKRLQSDRGYEIDSGNLAVNQGQLALGRDTLTQTQMRDAMNYALGYGNLEVNRMKAAIEQGRLSIEQGRFIVQTFLNDLPDALGKYSKLLGGKL